MYSINFTVNKYLQYFRLSGSTNRWKLHNCPNCSAVTVFKPKLKTAGFKAKQNRTETTIFWRLCDGFSRISKMAQPDHKSLQQ